jgi:phosphatidylserine/phosphatidylglycerophosphate/cardiolipin synthase-like enzyme
MQRSVLISLVIVFSAICCSSDQANDSDLPSIKSSLIVSAETGEIQSRQKIVELIDSARSSVQLTAYNITCPQVVAALKRACDRHVTVECIVDSKVRNQSQIKSIIASGISVHGRAYDRLMGSTFVIIDRDIIIAGAFALEEISNSFDFVFVLRDRDTVRRFINEFAVLKKGVDPVDKDSDFDYTVGPFNESMSRNPIYNPAWYKSIQLSSGTLKGVWPVVSTTLPIETYLMPYQSTDLAYGGWEYNAGIGRYDSSSISISYTDFPSGITGPDNISDARNVLIPYLQNAKSSIAIYAFCFTDSLLASTITTLVGSSGIKVYSYLDYSFCRQNTGYYAVFRQMASISDIFRLVRPSISGKMRGGMIIIDDETIILSSSGFSNNAFVSNDGYLLVLKNAKLYVDNFKREFSRMISESESWPNGDSFTGDFNQYEYIARY